MKIVAAIVAIRLAFHCSKKETPPVYEHGVFSPQTTNILHRKKFGWHNAHKWLPPLLPVGFASVFNMKMRLICKKQ